MKRWLAVFAIAVLLAVGAVTVRSAAAPSPVQAACSGWYYAKYGNRVDQSYWNYATGRYAYVSFQNVVVGNDCTGQAFGRTIVWTTDGFYMGSATLQGRAAWYGQASWGVTCLPASNNVYVCDTRIGAGNAADMWSDNWNGSYTYVTGPFGGQFGGQAGYSHAG